MPGGIFSDFTTSSSVVSNWLWQEVNAHIAESDNDTTVASALSFRLIVLYLIKITF